MFELPTLPYSYDSLEPHIDEKTMHLHHEKHHATYVTNLNAALEQQPKLSGMSIEDLLQNLDSLPESIRATVRNNGGGHYNHSLFWTLMSPDGGGEPEESLNKAISKDFGDFTAFKDTFNKAGLGRFGSGWVWVVLKNNTLEITSTPNQDSPIMDGIKPILCCDVWEHAYYVKYHNRRADYLSAWWNIVNWNKVAELYQSSQS